MVGFAEKYHSEFKLMIDIAAHPNNILFLLRIPDTVVSDDLESFKRYVVLILIDNLSVTQVKLVEERFLLCFKGDALSKELCYETFQEYYVEELDFHRKRDSDLNQKVNRLEKEVTDIAQKCIDYKEEKEHQSNKLTLMYLAMILYFGFLSIVLMVHFSQDLPVPDYRFKVLLFTSFFCLAIFAGSAFSLAIFKKINFRFFGQFL